MNMVYIVDKTLCCIFTLPSEMLIFFYLCLSTVTAANVTVCGMNGAGKQLLSPLMYVCDGNVF